MLTKCEWVLGKVLGAMRITREPCHWRWSAMASLWEFHLNRVPKGKERRKDIPGRENNFSEDSEIGKKVDFLEKVRTVCPGETRVWVVWSEVRWAEQRLSGREPSWSTGRSCPGLGFGHMAVFMHSQSSLALKTSSFMTKTRMYSSNPGLEIKIAIIKNYRIPCFDIFSLPYSH